MQNNFTYGVSTKTLRELAEWNSLNPEARAISLYIDLNREEFATSDVRDTALNSVLSELQEEADEETELCVEQIREALEDYNTDEVEGLAVFCSPDLELLHILPLPQAVERQVHVGLLNIRPLLNLQKGDKWCVLLVNRENARIFVGTEYSLKEIAQVHDDVKNQHKKGGWSQARFERSVDQEVTDHVENAQNEVMDFLMKHDFDHLLVGAPEGLRNEVEHELHSYLSEKLRGFITIDIDNTSEQEVQDIVLPNLVSYREQTEKETLERFTANHGRGELAAHGLSATLDALTAMRVDTLLLTGDFQAAGVYCPSCSYLAPQGKECPLDGTELVREEDITPKAVELALLQSAAVCSLQNEENAKELESVAAILRF